MAKRVVQMFVLVVTAATGKVLGDFLQPSFASPVHAAVGLGVGAVLLAILEQQYVLPVNWWWHRFWYVRDLQRYLSDLQRNESDLTNSTDRFPATQILVDGKRRDLLTYATTRLTDNNRSAARLLVQGETGSGKSFAATQIALDLARTVMWKPKLRMPIFIRLGGYRDGTLESYIATEIQKTTVGNSGKVISAGLDTLMRKGRVSLILDALDETPESIRTKMLSEMQNFEKPARKKIHLLMTVRAREILRSEIPIVTEAFEIQPLDDAAVDRLIEAYAQPN